MAYIGNRWAGRELRLTKIVARRKRVFWKLPRDIVLVWLPWADWLLGVGGAGTSAVW
jgi:hypothetical protein